MIYKYDIQVQYRDMIEMHDDAKLDLSSLAESLGLHLTFSSPAVASPIRSCLSAVHPGIYIADVQ